MLKPTIKGKGGKNELTALLRQHNNKSGRGKMDFTIIDGIEIDEQTRKELLGKFYKVIPRDSIFLARDILAQGLPVQQCASLTGVKESDCKKLIQAWQEFLLEEISRVTA